MISILIPVYNYDIRSLVQGLHDQAIATQQPFEIIVADDASNDLSYTDNIQVEKLTNVKFIKLNHNIGRSKIRNLLAEEAKYHHLLFIDADAKIISNDFLHKYLQHCNDNSSVVCGGLRYDPLSNIDQDCKFRWLYGIKREEKDAEKRNLKPYDSFSTFNFLTTKEIQRSILFDENMRRYGHEDTMFGINLQMLNIPIKHIDNPLIHSGLEDINIFLSKTKQSLLNLKSIMNRQDEYTEVVENINILRIYKKLKKWRLCWSVKLLYFLTYPILMRNLKGNSPKLWVFDLYKLGYLCAV